MWKSSLIYLTIIIMVVALQFEKTQSVPISKSTPQLNLLSHFKSVTGLLFPNQTESKCKSSGCATIPGEAQNTSKDESSFREKKLYVPAVMPTQILSCNPDECGCPDEFAVICGSDGVSYGNRCLLQCNQKCNRDVKEFHDGYCGKIFFKNSVSTVFQASQKRRKPIVYKSLS